MNMIIVAMPSEALDIIKAKKLEQVESKPFAIYKNDKNILVVSGIGKANAAAGLSYALSKYDANNIINFGVAGSLNNDHNALDIFISTENNYGDVDATAFGYELGQVPQEEKSFNSSSKLISIVKTIEPSIKESTFTTTDSFQGTLSLLEKHPKTSVVDMEVTAYNQIANKFNKEFISIKVVSDVVGKEKQNAEQYEQNLSVAVSKITETVIKLLGELNE